MAKTIFVAALAGVLFTANPLHSCTDVNGTEVVAKCFFLDAAETAWIGNLPTPLVTLPIEFEKNVVMVHPDSKAVDGYRQRPPAKWEVKG